MRTTTIARLVLSCMVAAAGVNASAIAAEKPALEVLPAQLELLADDAQYQQNPAEAKAITGVLGRILDSANGGASSFFVTTLSGRRLLAADGLEAELLPYLNQRVRIEGKPVGKADAARLLPGRLTVLTAGSYEPVTTTPPVAAVSENLSLPNVNLAGSDGTANGSIERQLKIHARVPHSGSESPGIPLDPKGTVIRSQRALNKLLGQATASGLAKQMGVEEFDFDRQMLIHVFGGKRSTGGWRVQITSIEIGPDGETATVEWELRKPEGFATQVITYPGEIVLVDRFDGEIKFRPKSGKSAAK